MTHSTRVLFITLLFVLIACFDGFAQENGAQTAMPTATYSKWMVDAQGENAILGTYDYHYAGAYDQTDKTNTGKYASKKWDYVPGLVCKALLRFNAQYKNSTIAGVSDIAATALSRAQGYANGCVTENATTPITVGSGYFEKNSIDAIATSKILLDLYDETHREKYKTAAKWVYDYLVNEYPRIEQDLGKGGFYHKGDYPNQMWLDGLYMGAAFYAEYLNSFDAANTDAWTDIANQFIMIDNYTWDPVKKLHYHVWAAKVDTNAFWAGSWNENYEWVPASTNGQGHSREFWGRGVGWYFAALVDVLEFMPESHPNYNDLKNILSKVADGLKDRQDAEKGVWCQLLQFPVGTKFAKGDYNSGISNDTNTSTTEIANYFESSASCMFTYAYYKAIRLGLIDGTTYLPVANKAFEGIRTNLMSNVANNNIKLKNICRSAGLGPAKNSYRDGTQQYYLFGKDTYEIATNEGKGVGPYIMACLEKELAEAGKTNLVVGFKNFNTEIEEDNLVLSFSDIIATSDMDAVTVAVNSDVDGFATVDNGNKTVTLNKVGTGSITVTYGGDDSRYMAGSKYLAFTVTKGVVRAKTIVVSPINVILTVGNTVDLSCQILPEETTDKTVVWSTEKEKIATVDADGKVTAHAEGTVKITATSNSNKALYDYCVVTVLPAAQTGGSGESETLFSWSSPSGTAIIPAGSISQEKMKENGTNRLNYSNTANSITYHTICLSGQKANINDSSGSDDATYMLVTSTKALQAGDVIYMTAYRNKNSSSASSAYLLFSNDAYTTIGGSDGLGFVNLNADGDTPTATAPNTLSYTITSAEAGSTSFKMTRDKSGTNLFITKLEIIRKTENTGGSGGNTTEPTYLYKYISSFGWASFVPEENVKVPGSGVKVYYIKNGTYNESSTSVKAVPVPAGTVIAKDCGYIINAEEGTYSFEVVTANDENGNSYKISDNMLLCGNDDVIESGSLAFGYVNDTPGFYRLNNYSIKLPKGVVYIESPGGAGQQAPTSITLSFDSEDATGVGSVGKGNITNVAAYNLAGQRVDDGFKGIVVVNGKKMLRK